LTVEEGKVAFSTKKDNKIISVNLEAGHRGIINKNNKSITEVKYDDINYSAWKTGRLSFRNTPLKKIAEDLSRFYKTRFVSEDAESDTVKVTIVFDHKSIEEVIEAMDFLGIQIAKNNEVYSIRLKAMQ
jgi:ferric-dicitrate binding protein FerR (iron transport regulator)